EERLQAGLADRERRSRGSHQAAGSRRSVQPAEHGQPFQLQRRRRSADVLAAGEHDRHLLSAAAGAVRVQGLVLMMRMVIVRFGVSLAAQASPSQTETYTPAQIQAGQPLFTS